MATPEVPLRYVGVNRRSAAFRLMKQMGWEEGEGLGQEKQGIKGYSQSEEQARMQDTLGCHLCYNVLILCASKRLMSTWMTDEADEKDEVKSASKSVPSNNNQEMVAKVTRPQGRYKKREKRKLIQGYSSQDHEGILVVTKIQMLRTTFNEDDQENLYKLVQDKATSGKQGLGIKDCAKKLAGCYFQVKKTNFDDSYAEDSSNFDSPIKRKLDENSEVEMGVESKEKIEKLCRRILQQVPKESLKLRQLKKLIDEHWPSTFSNISSEESLSSLKHKLSNSDRFSIKGKSVFLSKRN